MASGSYAQDKLKSPSLPPVAPVVAIHVDARVATALDDKNINYTLLQPNKLFQVNYAMPGGRHQHGQICSFTEQVNTSDPKSPYVRRIWSIAYSTPELPSSGTLAKLMIASNKTKIGAWEIVKEPNGDYSVLYNIKADADTPPDTLIWMLQTTCNLADTAEKDHAVVDAELHKSDSSYKPTADKF